LAFADPARGSLSAGKPAEETPELLRRGYQT